MVGLRINGILFLWARESHPCRGASSSPVPWRLSLTICLLKGAHPCPSSQCQLAASATLSLTGTYLVPSLKPHFAQVPQPSMGTKSTLYFALAKETDINWIQPLRELRTRWLLFFFFF